MKHKLLTVLLALLTAMCLCLGFAGCGETRNNGGIGTDGNGSQGSETCAHQYTAENVCSLCGDKWEFTEGLTYELDEGTDTYHVLHIQKENGDVVVPYGYQGKFVTAVFDWTREEVEEVQETAGPEQIMSDSLTGITLPDSVTHIGEYSFLCCQGLKNVNLGKSLTSIEKAAFALCSSMTSIVIPDGVTSIGTSAFYYCRKLANVFIHDSVTSIGLSAFYHCIRLTSIIHDSVTSIGLSAFYHCIRLTSIEIPEEMTSIEFGTFAMCDELTKVVIPAGVTLIGDLAFDECGKLTDIRFKGTMEAWEAIEKGNRWDSYTDKGKYIVTCTNGTAAKDGTVTYFNN